MVMRPTAPAPPFILAVVPTVETATAPSAPTTTVTDEPAGKVPAEYVRVALPPPQAEPLVVLIAPPPSAVLRGQEQPP